MEDDKNEKQLKWKTTCIHRDTDVTYLRFAGFLNINMSRAVGIIGKLFVSRSLICKGAEHMKMIFIPTQKFPSSFFIISFPNDCHLKELVLVVGFMEPYDTLDSLTGPNVT